jgi:hypothetical protein
MMVLLLMDENKYNQGAFLPYICGVTMVFVIILLVEITTRVVSLSQDPHFASAASISH